MKKRRRDNVFLKNKQREEAESNSFTPQTTKMFYEFILNFFSLERLSDHFGFFCWVLSEMNEFLVL